MPRSQVIKSGAQSPGSLTWLIKAEQWGTHKVKAANKIAKRKHVKRSAERECRSTDFKVS